MKINSVKNMTKKKADYHQDYGETVSLYTETGISIRKFFYPAAFIGSLAAGYYMLKETGSTDAFVMAIENTSNAAGQVSDFSQVPDFIGYSLVKTIDPIMEALGKTYGAISAPALIAAYTGAKTLSGAKELLFTPAAKNINTQDNEQLERFLQSRVRKSK